MTFDLLGVPHICSVCVCHIIVMNTFVRVFLCSPNKKQFRVLTSAGQIQELKNKLCACIIIIK